MLLHEELQLTVKQLYGDLLDFPWLAPGASVKNPAEELRAYAEKIRFCSDCVLHVGRVQSVFGRGLPSARLAFLGDFPSLHDDQQAEPFSDESGALLHKMILAMKVKPEETYLTNLFKCHPPHGQAITRTQIDACYAHLEAQFSLVSAPFVVALGDLPAKVLARSESPLPVLRKQTFEWNGRQVFCTHHPRELLESPAKKKEAWEDLQRVMQAMKP